MHPAGHGHEPLSRAAARRDLRVSQPPRVRDDDAEPGTAVDPLHGHGIRSRCEKGHRCDADPDDAAHYGEYVPRRRRGPSEAFEFLPRPLRQPYERFIATAHRGGTIRADGSPFDKESRMRRQLLYLGLVALAVLTVGASTTLAARGSGTITYQFNGRLLADAGHSSSLF